MARHRKDYSGERLTAYLHLQLTPADRLAIDVGAAEEGISPSEFGRALLLNGLRAYAIGGPARAAKRKEIAGAIERLSLAGNDLNALARQANETRRIARVKAVGAVCMRLVNIMEEVPPRVASRRKNPDLKRLVAELAAIGNNVQQLRGLAKAEEITEADLALAGVQSQIMKTLDQVMPA